MGLGLGIVPKFRRSLSHMRLWWDQWHDVPAVLHITHWKAGSQWIHRILDHCLPERMVKPMEAYGHLLAGPIRRSMIYPTVYATREQLEQLSFPCPVRRFVVIRDLRDALVSMYFSLKVSHGDKAAIVKSQRAVLQTVGQEDGLIHLIEANKPSAAIIRSWVGGDDPLLRYEDLLANDEQLLMPVLLDHCRLPISRQRLAASIRAHRFEQLARGRQRGQEDVAAHVRKGIAGDWRNHFTERVKDEFKKHFGDMLIAAGYEKDDRW